MCGEDAPEGRDRLSKSTEPGRRGAAVGRGLEWRFFCAWACRDASSVTGGRRSKMCNVPLSEVDAMKSLFGDMARPYVVAASTPRLNS